MNLLGLDVAHVSQDLQTQLHPSPFFKYFGHVPRISQHFNWDCGLACTLMVLRAFGIKNYDMQNLREMLKNVQSVWSIDIAFILCAAGVDVEYLTTTYGANEAYAAQNLLFYADTTKEDIERVNTLFSKAAAAGIAVVQRSFSLLELRQLVNSSRQQLVIALVDKLRLGNFADAPQISPRSIVGFGCLNETVTSNKSHPMLTRAQRSSKGRTNDSSSGTSIDGQHSSDGGSIDTHNELLYGTTDDGDSSPSFIGHYIVIYGWEAGHFLIRDPACSHWKIPEETLDAARKAFGTDEDLLVCRMRC